MRVRRQHKAPTALTSLTENPVSGVYRFDFFPNGDRLKDQQNELEFARPLRARRLG
jgi:hypothetical protein